MKRNERIHLFVDEIWAWYAVHKRILPWRDLTDTDPTQRAYKVLVSEIMLQQTQVPRVILTYKEFLRRFPTIHHLAEASTKEVLIAWRGMGYNSRALRLRDVAREIVKSEKWKVKSDRKFPTSMEDLTALPGIGHYTAAAIRNFAFNVPTPCIDTNIRRILHRTFVGPEHPDGSWEKDDEYLLGIAAEVLEEAISNKGNKRNRGNKGSSISSFSSISSAEWHAALMDYGSLVQTKRSPKWDICPLTREGIMKATKMNYELRIMNYGKNARTQSLKKREPGRTVGSVFIPNRIFRGRVIEALRDAPKGLTLHDIGAQIALDWDPEEHREWLSGILKQLIRETLLGKKKGNYVLG